VINTLQATTPSDGSDGKAPERVHAGVIYQVLAAFRRAQASPQCGVPQGKASDGRRGLSCGWTIGPAPSRSAMAGRESSA
jgi:hypothetical protein